MPDVRVLACLFGLWAGAAQAQLGGTGAYSYAAPITSTPTATSAGANTATSAGTLLTSGAANTKGSWTEIVHATAANASSLVVMINSPDLNAENSGLQVSCLVDIGTGASGSEAVLLPNLALSQGGIRTHVVELPMFIPAGTRIAAREQCTIASENTTNVALLLLDGPFYQKNAIVTKCETYNASTTTSIPVPLDLSGLAANTKSAWLTLGTTSFAISRMWIFNGVNNYQSLGGLLGYHYSYLNDFALGTGGSPAIFLPNVYSFASGGLVTSPYKTQFVGPLVQGPFPVALPSGATMLVRGQWQSPTGPTGQDPGTYTQQGISVLACG